MQRIDRRRLLRIGTLSAALPGTGPGLRKLDGFQGAWAASDVADMPPPDREALLLSRAAFGARPGELDALRKEGVEAWLEGQLDAESIRDRELDRVLADQLPTLAMPAEDLWALSREQGQIGRIRNELRLATVYRQIFSQRQLLEVMVDFWSDHLSINQAAGNPRVLKTIDDREVVRKHALGKFRDLITASATSPAMLVYLDNDSNTKRKPNENYARELLELHTLGVAKDGDPYSEEDVKEVARCFTGWTWDTGRSDAKRAGHFLYASGNHDMGVKQVLGQVIPASQGEQDGHMVIDLLCRHPATARFIATKLVRRFVSDDPVGQVPALVDRVAEVFLSSDGDIKAMLRTILLSDTFADSFATYGGRLSRPLDHVVRALRALDLSRSDLGEDFSARTFTRFVSALMGGAGFLTLMEHIPFSWETPDGFPDVKEKWTSTGLLLARWNYGLALAEGQVAAGFEPVARRPAARVGSGEIVDWWIDRLLQRGMIAGDRARLVDFLSDGAGEDAAPASGREAYLMALILDSPYFLWR